MTHAQTLIPYLRQSRTKEQSISIGDQRTAIQRWAEAAGVKLAAEIVEESVSGSKPWRERELGQAMKTVEAGQAAGLIVAYQDRLSRENGIATAEVWEALANADARLVCAAEGTNYRPSEDHDGEMLYTIKSAIARHQWQRHRLNWSNARRSAIERGVKPGPCPAGYARAEGGRLEPNGDADAIREAFRLRAETKAGWHHLARYLTAQGVTSARGGTEWSASAAQRLISCRVYLGEIKSGEFVNPAAHPALVDETTFRRAGRTIPNGSYRRGDGPLLGGGLCRCGTCGSALVRSVSKGWEHLRCSGGTLPGPHACCSLAALEPYLISEALARHPGWLTNLNQEVDPGLDIAVRDAEAALAEVEALQGTVRPAAYAVALSEAQDTLEAAQQASAEAAPTGAPVWAAVDPREMLFEEDPAEDVLGQPLHPGRLIARDVPTARQFLREMLGEVVVKPGSGVPVEERVTLAA
jgi:DNA invertase Pin-like site-specific DNA recombinase